MAATELEVPALEPVKIKIVGKEFLIDLTKERSGQDLADYVAALFFLLAEAKYQAHRLESEFKMWKTAAIATVVKKIDVPEWKAKLRVETSEEFSQYQEGFAQAERTINVIRSALAVLHYGQKITLPASI